MAQDSRRIPGQPQSWQTLEDRGKSFLELGPRKRFAQTAMRSGPKYQVSARTNSTYRTQPGSRA